MREAAVSGNRSSWPSFAKVSRHASLAFLLTAPAPTFAGPPFVTDDPEPVEYQHYETYFFTLGSLAAGEAAGVALPDHGRRRSEGAALWNRNGSRALRT
ncbi:MAG TPA: hypothetical protein VEK34_16435 [Methylocella sp.]|nr:hypothetical protein [Methylocella sp.]